MRCKRPVRFLQSSAGFTLVELLLTMALLGMVTLAITNMLIKGSTYSATMDTRYQEAMEVQALVLDMMQELSQGAYISNNSHTARLEYTTYNASGTATKKIYSICYAPATVATSDTSCSVSSSTNNTAFLKLSTDGGSTWGSPYRISAFNKYQLTGTPIFLYSHTNNNCTSFVDTDANGIWLGSAFGGSDAAGTRSDCGAHTAGGSYTMLDNPNQATKVVLHGFQFAALKGGGSSQSVARSLPTNIFMAAPQGLVVSTASAVSPGVKDSPLLKSFDTKTANSLFGSSFKVYGVLWDSTRQRLLVDGIDGSNSKIFQVDRMGVLIGPALTLSNSSIVACGIALLDDGSTVVVADYAGSTLYWYSLNGTSPLTPIKSLVLTNPSTSSPALAGSTSLVTSPRGVAYDPKYPNEIFVQGIDPADSKYKIFEIDTTTGSLATNVLSGGKLAMPAAIDATHVPWGLSQEPTTGDFLVTRDYVNGSSPSKTIDIYRITSSGSSTSFSVNIDDLAGGTNAVTTTNGAFGISYAPELNHLFMSDVYNGKMYEVYPDRIISPRS